MSSMLCEVQTYDPGRLLDALIARLHLKNDAALAAHLGFAPPVISKVRNRKIPVGATLLIAMHEASMLSIGELRRLMGDQRASFRGPWDLLAKASEDTSFIPSAAEIPATHAKGNSAAGLAC